MKKFLTVFLVIGNLSIFAQDSEFERGFEAGQEMCQVAKEAWNCSLTCKSGYTSAKSYFSYGRTRAEAILNNYCAVDKKAYDPNKVDCKKL